MTTVSGGNWVNHSGGTPFVGYQTASLSLTGYSFSSAGGAATISSSGSEDVNRAFPAQPGNIYLSALINVTSPAGTGAYFLHFKNAATTFRAKVFAQDSGGNLRFGLQANAEAVEYSTTNFSYGTTYLLVLHYDATAVTGGKTDLHVLTSVPPSEPATPLLSHTDTTPVQTMAAVAIRQAAGGPTAVIDGIRVSTSFSGLTLPVELMKFDVK